MDLATDGLGTGQLLLGVALLQDQLFPDRCGGQPRVQPSRLERRVSLALVIHEGFDVGEQLGEVLFGAFAPTQAKGIYAADAGGKFAHPLADGHPVPPQFALGLPLPMRAEPTDRSCQEEAPTRTAQRVSSPL